jgi:hypothetical protein
VGGGKTFASGADKRRHVAVSRFAPRMPDRQALARDGASLVFYQPLKL